MKALFLFLILLTYAISNAAKDATSSKPETVDKVIAIVSTEALLQSDVTDFSANLNKEGAIDESLLLDDKISDLKSSKANQLQYLIREKLVQAEIKRQNLSLTDDRVDQEMATLAKRNRMTKAELEAYLKKQGYSIASYKQTLKARLERQSFFESEIVSKLRITDDDAYNEYKNKTPNYRPNVDEFKISQIFFNPKKGSEKDALARAEEVFKKANQGESFEALANKYSEDAGANAGGYLGQFKSGEFNPEIEKAIARLDKGNISQIIRTKLGFHIVKVLDKKITQDPNFLRYKDQIKASLVEQNFKRQLKNWFESKKQDSYIKIYE